jgi:hypothetical protein
MTVNQILKNLKDRFLSGTKMSEIVQRFLSEEIPNSLENFFDMLKDGRYLIDVSYMSARTVADQVSKRAPREIRIAIWEAKVRISSFDAFAKLVEQAVSLSYNKEGRLYIKEVELTINRTSKVTGSKKKEFTKKKCELHGEGTHLSDECRTLKKIKSLGWSQNKSKEVSRAETEE